METALNKVLLLFSGEQNEVNLGGSIRVSIPSDDKTNILNLILTSLVAKQLKSNTWEEAQEERRERKLWLGCKINLKNNLEKQYNLICRNN